MLSVLAFVIGTVLLYEIFYFHLCLLEDGRFRFYVLLFCTFTFFVLVA